VDFWAIARYDLRLSDSEWLGMTFRQIYALRKRRIQEMQWQEIMFSRLTAAVINFSFSHPDRPVSEDFFMMHPLPKTEPPPVEKELAGETLLRLLRNLPPGAATQVN
jgi:hypothetical protein